MPFFLSPGNSFLLAIHFWRRQKMGLAKRIFFGKDFFFKAYFPDGISMVRKIWSDNQKVFGLEADTFLLRKKVNGQQKFAKKELGHPENKLGLARVF